MRLVYFALPLCGFIAGCDSTPARSQLFGNWAIIDHVPTGSREDNCSTDYAVTFNRDGSYYGLFESGNWELNSNALNITASLSNADSGGEGPELPLKPPHHYNWPIVKLNGAVAEVKAGDTRFWLYRCGAGE